MTIHLEPKNPAEKRIKEYLEQNASELLADKINNGVFIQKDGKRFLNRKNLSSFMKYATDEARKLAEKEANSACVEDDIVYGWAIHYFEEDSIEGTLYQEDGTIYKPEQKSVQRIPTPTVTTPKKPEKSQMSLFEMLSEEPKKEDPVPTETIDEDEPTEEEMHEAMENDIVDVIPFTTKPKPTVSPLYQKYTDLQNKHPDAVVAYRLGDFYEVFGEHAKVIARELDLTLTGRDCGLEERIPMVGFPYHAAETYFHKINLNHALLIANNDDIQYKSVIDVDDVVDDDLTESEMREFDGDIAEEKHWIDDKTYADELGEIHTVDEELQPSKMFDTAALAIFYELLGDELDIQEKDYD